MSLLKQTAYLRPTAADPSGPAAFAQAAGRFDGFDVLSRDKSPERTSVNSARANTALAPLADAAMAARAPLAGIPLDRPRVMGIVNVTPDSFSDGGQFGGASAAIDGALTLVDEGADLLDIGGESTRPGAAPVSLDEECRRVLPVIEGLVAEGCPVPISIDTRNAVVARAALDAGAVLFNDVSALTHDPDSLGVAQTAQGVCLMHAQGTPETMQKNPRYDDVLLDIYDALAARVSVATKAGISRDRILVDPGIGFGKTLAHNLALVRGLSLFHGLGCGILLGLSRKGFIGKLAREDHAAKRMPGSVAGALAGVMQGAHVLRVHDVAATVQALAVWTAVMGQDPSEGI